MRAAEIYSYPVQTSAFDASPLQQRRAVVQAEMAAGPAPQVELDTTVFSSSPLRDNIEQARQDVVYNFKPLGVAQGSISDISTPPYTRGQYQMYASDGLSVSVDLGPLMWNHVDRSSSVGGLVDTFA